MEETFEYIPIPKPSRVCIIGSGLVGSTYAYTLLTHGISDEICLIDINRDKAEGDAMDLNHSMPFATKAEIWAGDMEDVRDADIIVICAGAAQKPNESRLELLKRNASIVGSIAEEAGSLAPSAVYLVATNPVDVMAYVAMTRSGCHPSHVIGSGTTIDTARLRFLIGKTLDIDPRSIHAFVMGEHGDSEMIAWSRATIAGSPLEHYKNLSPHIRKNILEDVRMAAYHIIEKKGATYFAIAAALSRITEAILKDQRTVYSVSAYLEGEYGIFDTYLGVPAVIGREGVLSILEMPLSPKEAQSLHASEKVVRNAISSLDLQPKRRRKEVLLHEIAQELGPEQGIEWDEEASNAALQKTRKVRRPLKRPRHI
jgi:L-lactate dehydrogenase